MSTIKRVAAHFMFFLLALSATSLTSVEAGQQMQETSDDSLCPRQLHRRSVEQVIEAHLAAFRSGNAALIACDYAKNAVFMLPGTVAHGRDEIQATFAGFFQVAGPISSVLVTSTTTDKGAVLMTYKVDSQHILVPDGVDTIVVVDGRIVLHTGYLGGLSVR